MKNRIVKQLLGISVATILFAQMPMLSFAGQYDIGNGDITITATADDVHTVTYYESVGGEEKTATGEVLRQFKVKSLIGLGLDSMIPGVLAAGASLIYLHDTQKTDLSNLSEIHPYIADKFMMLDSSSRRNLECRQIGR